MNPITSESELAARLIGSSPPIRELRRLILRIAPQSTSVVIHGSTGSGKELVAQALHAASGRKGRYVAFNVCAIPDTMFESTLFGHVRGAFTGAVSDNDGYLVEADRGTIFLDEISGLPLFNQMKLLRAVETREFRPVGARQDRRSEFRVVAASNDDLPGLAHAGQFRQDLLFRLRGIPIEVPLLADRLEDVPALALHFAREAARPGEPVEIKPTAIRELQAYDWPGNVRELRQVIECAIALAGSSRLG